MMIRDCLTFNEIRAAIRDLDYMSAKRFTLNHFDAHVVCVHVETYTVSRGSLTSPRWGQYVLTAHGELGHPVQYAIPVYHARLAEDVAEAMVSLAAHTLARRSEVVWAGWAC